MAVLVVLGNLSRGFRLPAAGLQIYAEADVFEEERRVPERRRSATKAFLSDLRDLKVGDLVVHIDHGIGMFVGLKQIGVGDSVQEFLELRYAGEDKLFVPVERLIPSRSTLKRRPRRSSRRRVAGRGNGREAGATWPKSFSRRRAQSRTGSRLQPRLALAAGVRGRLSTSHARIRRPRSPTSSDMESGTPMDRLLCGDVGYGKTEVAMRGAFKAVMRAQVAFRADDGAMFQHEKTLKERFAGFPVYRDGQPFQQSRAERHARRSGGRQVDVIVPTGCCRGTSNSATWDCLSSTKSSAGVSHKEKIKQLRKKVDVPMMSATPIPRTLNMSLVGIRDMSIIETPPKDRLSIQNQRVKFDLQVIARAIATSWREAGSISFTTASNPSSQSATWSSARARSAGRRRPRQMGEDTSSARCSISSRRSSTFCWRRPSSRTASTFPTPTPSSSTGRSGTPSQLYQPAAASAGPIARRMRICSSRRKTICRRLRKTARGDQGVQRLGSGPRGRARPGDPRRRNRPATEGQIDAVGFDMLEAAEQTVRE
jgi:transcription-repair coupling factor (superfamily II helicase)